MSGARYFPTRAHLLVCTGPRCRELAPDLFARIWDRLERDRLAYYAGGTVRLTESGCQGACEHGPNAICYHEAAGSLEQAWFSGMDERSLAAIAGAAHAGEPLPARGRYDRAP